jgi:hypothetical protein
VDSFAAVTPRSAGLAAALLLSAVVPVAAAPTSDDAFEAKYRDADANRRTAEGAAYDGALARAFDTIEVRAALERCLRASPGPHALRGYFTVLGIDAYQLEVRPREAFASCVERAFEGRPGLPLPPRTPWLNQFDFVVDGA